MTKSVIEGAFLHRTESISVLEGSYEAPVPDAAWSATTLTFSEGFLEGAIDEGQFAVRVGVHVELAPEDPTRCDCGPTLVTPAPPWAEAHHARMDFSSELGGHPLSSDPALREVEPLPSWSAEMDEYIRPFAFDADAEGFTLRAQYLVTPEDCDDATCWSVVEVVHHFRRP